MTKGKIFAVEHVATNRNERSGVKRIIMTTFSVDSHKHDDYLQYTIGSVTHFIHSFIHGARCSLLDRFPNLIGE